MVARSMAAAPVWTFEVGHISSGTRRSRTKAARRPRSTVPSALDGDVVDDPDAVAEPLRARELERLPDRRQPERLAGVDRDVEVLAPDLVERIEVAGRRVALLGPGDVEPDDAGVAPADRALGDLDRAGRLAHRRDEHLHDDRVAGRGGSLHPDPEPLEVRLDDLVEGQPVLGRQLRRVADLGVDDAVGGEVLGALGGDPDDRVALLHDPERVLERLEVELERLPVGAATEPRGQVVDVASSAGRRSRTRAARSMTVAGPEAAVEVVVEERLRGLSGSCRG